MQAERRSVLLISAIGAAMLATVAVSGGCQPENTGGGGTGGSATGGTSNPTGGKATGGTS